jgi:serine/threonine protein kinase
MTTPFPEPLKVNGRYEISEKPLGEGGAGTVYRAYDTVTKRFVALKAIWADPNPATLGMFRHEWTVLAHVSHPNIVDVLDIGEWTFDGQLRPYFVMPLLPGETLAQLLNTSGESLTLERAIDITVQACRGLQAAHDQGLIHRDIKPSNILVIEDGTVKIMDFGMAQSADLPSAGGVKAMPSYRAPEQLDGKPATPMSDIFALAAICYETLTGRKPFERETGSETAQAIRACIPQAVFELNPAVNEAIGRTVQKALAKQPYHRFLSAREFGDTLQKALRNEPIERFEPAKIQPRIERVRKATAEGDYQFAREILAELESEGHLDAEMPALRAQIERAARQKQIRQLLDNARIRMDEEEYPLALQKIADVLSLDPENADAQSLKTRIERLRSENQLEGWFRLVREHRDNHLFGQARQGLHEILKLDSVNTQARQMLAEIDETEKEIIKAREEKQRLYESAVASYRSGEISAALTRLERVLALSKPGARSASPDLDAQCQSLYNQVREERNAARNAYAEGRKRILERDVGRALEICDEYLEKNPGDPMFQALKLEAEELERQQLAAAVAEVNRLVDIEPDLDKKHNLLKEAVEKHPDEPHFRSAMKLIRDRRDLVSTIVGRARQYEERGQFDDAGGQWEILRNIYPSFAGLDSEIERLTQRRREQLQVESRALLMERIEECLKTGDYATALAGIGEALNEFPDNQELRHLESIAELGAKRGSKAAALLKDGQNLCASRKYEQGLAALRKAERLDPRNAMARAALISGLVAHARELLPKDWRAAEPLVKEALDLEPSDPVARSLLSILDDHRRQDAVAHMLLAARNYQADGHLSDALQLLERGLVQYPNDPRLIQLLKSLRSESSIELPRPSVKAAAPIAASAPQSSLPADEPAQPKLFAPPAGTVPPPSNETAAPATRPLASPGLSLTVQPQRAMQRRPSALPAAALRTPGIVNEARFKGPIWGVATATALALIIAAAIYSLTHKPNPPAREAQRVILADARVIAVPLAGQTRPVVLESNVPGTRFTENGKMLPALPDFGAGSHTVEASHEGYLSDLKTFSVDAGATSPISVKFDLNPALTQLKLNSSITAGTLLLDEATSLNLEAGAVSKEDLPPGPHTVKIYDHKRQVFSLAFEARPNQLPVLITPLGEQPVAGTVIASLAGEDKVYTTTGFRARQQPAGHPVMPVLSIELAGAP